jgi:hypothetical protein
MSNFEFVVSLYSLLFGLALAQVFGGFGNTLQERHKIPHCKRRFEVLAAGRVQSCVRPVDAAFL